MSSRTRRKDPAWRIRERVVAIIERTISPDARVQHNEKLKVLGTTRKRQCDAVIRYGNPPREMIAIVEVQKRGRRPELTTFHGWITKMREVGAQQLFCVSEAGYPQSIIDDVATRHGPTVRLLTLNITANDLNINPFYLHPQLLVLSPKFNILSIEEFKINSHAPPLQIELKSNELCFSHPAFPDLLSFNSLISHILKTASNITQRAPHQISTWQQTVVIDLDEKAQLSFRHAEISYKILKLKCHIEITYSSSATAIEVEDYVYKQEFIEGSLAWVKRTVVAINDVETEITAVIRPDSDGMLRNLSFFTQQIV